MYYQWFYSHIPGAATYEILKVDRKSYLALGLGKAFKGKFPKDGNFSMNSERPEDVMEIDSPRTGDFGVLVSEHVCDFLEGLKVPGLELLEVQTLDHKGRPTKTSYRLMHPTRVVDCIDQEESDFEWNPLDDKAITAMYDLVMDTDKFTDKDLIIRPKFMEKRVFVREEVAINIMEQGFGGIRFAEPGI